MECELIEVDIRDSRKLCSPWSMLLLQTEENCSDLPSPKLCYVRSMKKTDVQYITPLYISVYFNHLSSSHWSQTLPDDNLDLYYHFSGKNNF